MVSLVITVIVVVLLTTMVVTSSNKSIYQASETQIKQQMSEVKKGVDAVRLTNAKTGKTDEDTINSGFIKVRVENPPETFVSFDEEQLTGYVVDLSVIDYQKLEIGRDYLSLMKGDIVTFEKDDVFLYDKAGKVYYAKGYEIGDGDLTYTGEETERKEPPKIEVISTAGGVIKLRVTPVYGGEISSVLVGTKHAHTNDGLNFEITVNKNGSYKVVATEEGGNSGVLIVEVGDINDTVAEAPILRDVYINNKEKYTNNQVATLHIEAENAAYMSISQNELVVPNVTDLAKWRKYEPETSISLREGENKVYVWCKNEDNIASEYKYTEITLDTIAPTRDAPSYAMNGFQILATCNQRDETSTNLTVKYGFKQVYETEYTWQDSQIIVDVQPGAKYMLITKATDMAGNTSESRTTTTENVLGIPDNVVITANPATAWTTRVTVDIKYPDTHGVVPYENLYRIDGGEWQVATSDNVTMTVIKNCKIEATVSAKLNNQDVKMGKIARLDIENIDRVDPYIFDIEIPNEYTQEGIYINGKVYDHESGLTGWTVTSNTTVPSVWEEEFLATNATVNISHYIDSNGIYYIWAKDAANNIGRIMIEIKTIDWDDPVINSFEINYGVEEAELVAKAIDTGSGLAAYAFVKGENATPTDSDWIDIENTTSEYTMTKTINQNDYYSIWVKDLAGRTAKMQKYARVWYDVSYVYYQIGDDGKRAPLKLSDSAGCNSYVDLSKTVTMSYADFIGWNLQEYSKVKLDSLKLGDETTGQENITVYVVFKYRDNITFISSNTAITYELNLTIKKSTPFTTLQYSYDNKTWTNYATPLLIRSNGTIYARTMFEGEVITTSNIKITNICENHFFTTATCTVGSFCTKCNKNNGGKLGHTLGSWYDVVPATCTTSGTARRDCARVNDCGVHETKTIEANGHSYGSFVVTKEATCTTKGTKTSTCSKCGDKKTQDINALNHNFTKSQTKAKSATCTEAAEYYYKCSRCSKTNGTYTKGEALGHVENYGYFSDSQHKIYCTRCSVTLRKEAHLYDQKGVHRKACSKCQAVLETDHEYSVYSNYSNQKHKVTCSYSGCGSAIYEEHEWTPRAGNIYICTKCGLQNK